MSNGQYSVPLLVTNWCSLFYAEREYLKSPGRNIKLNASNDVAQVVLDHNWCSVEILYGNIAIEALPPLVYCWEIEIVHCRTIFFSQELKFGITEMDHIGGNFYVYSDRGSVRNHHRQIRRYGTSFGDGDRIRMELDTARRTLSFWNNDSCQGVAFDGIDFEDCNRYRMVMELPAKDICVKLTRFDRAMAS